MSEKVLKVISVHRHKVREVLQVHPLKVIEVVLVVRVMLILVQQDLQGLHSKVLQVFRVQQDQQVMTV